MTWIEAARGPFERLLDAEADAGPQALRARLEGLRLAYLDLRAGGTDRPLAEGADAGRTKGPWVLWMLRKSLSPAAFEPVRERWRRGGALENVSLREVVESQSRSDFSLFFDFWVYGAQLPEYHLRRAEARPDRGEFLVTLQVENLGTGAYPAPVVVQSEEGARHEFSVSTAGGERAEVSCRLLTRPVLAAVDPEVDVLMGSGERPWVSVRLRRFRFF